MKKQNNTTEMFYKTKANSHINPQKGSIWGGRSVFKNFGSLCTAGQTVKLPLSFVLYSCSIIVKRTIRFIPVTEAIMIGKPVTNRTSQ